MKIQSLTTSWLLDWRGCFGQGIKWDAPLGLNFGLGLWRLHTMAIQVERPWEFMAQEHDIKHYGTLGSPKIANYVYFGKTSTWERSWER